MKTVTITGISGTLGKALGEEYLRKGWHVIGVSRREDVEGKGESYSELHVSGQESVENARELLDLNADLLILNAGQIETEIGEKGLPLTEMVESMNRVNYTWPAVVATEAGNRKWANSFEIIAIGSIADGAPSPFGPVYHAGKIAIHYFWLGVGPIVYYATEGKVKMRLYRPGAIKGPLAWAPINRLNEKGYKIRKKRVDGAPEANRVAGDIIKWIEKGKGWVGTWDEPISFKIFKYLHAFFPNLSYKVQ
ncbi:MAG: SDR family NAD(P)-dependent oxidoreductase, partial [Candidatus Kapaibacterium sp.]